MYQNKVTLLGFLGSDTEGFQGALRSSHLV